MRRPFGAAVVGLCAWALFFGSGVSPNRLTLIGGAAVVLAAATTAVLLGGIETRPRVGRAGAGFVACFAGLVVWQGLSIVWSIEPDNSWDYVNRGIVYLAFFVLGLLVAAFVPRPAHAAASALAVLVALVLAYAFLAKGIPSLYADYGRVARLRSPVGYWNALALLGDFALLLGLRRAARRRLDGVLLVFAGTLTVLLAYSRGGVAIAVAAAAAWLALDRRRLEALVALAIGAGAAVVVAGVSLALHGVTDDNQPRALRVHDGRLFLLAVALAAAAATLLARIAQGVELSPAERRRATRALLFGIVVAAAAGIAVVVAHAPAATPTTAAGSHCVQSASRFGCGSSDERLAWWREAWQSFEDEPLGGTGAGSFELSHRLRRAQFTRPVTEPHNFALQSLSETGIVGFLLFAGAVAFAASGLRRRARDDDAALVLALCLGGYLVHILIDVGYDFVAVSGPCFVVLGVLLGAPPGRASRREPLWALASVALAATAVLSLAAPYIASRKEDQALQKLDPALAARAHDWNPVAVEPLLIEAALEESRSRMKALALYRQAVDTQPENPEAWAQLGRFELEAMHDPCSAYRSLNQAYTLDRFNPEVSQKGGPLDRARARVNAGACG